jgi:hypothetical protein
MAFHFDKSAPPTMDEHLDTIVAISTRAASFWTAAHGWASKPAADLLAAARLDWLASFSRTLRVRVEEVTAAPNEPAAIIVGWAHIRTLVEGHLKLYLTVFLTTYLADAHAFKSQKTGKILEPGDLSFESMRQFLVKRGLLTAHHGFVATVQSRGNAIHAFENKNIGTAAEFLEHIPLYREFLMDLESSLPNPYA